jgi:hypothetical protein
VDHPIAPPRIDPARTPFERTGAFRMFGAEVMPDPEAAEEPYTKAIIHEQGFDGPPNVISSRALDRYVAIGEREFFRWLSAPGYGEDFRGGDLFVGRGSYGSGAYLVGGPHGLTRARSFGPGGTILRLSLKNGARVADYDELQEDAYRGREHAIQRLRTAQAAAEAEAVRQGDAAAMRQLDQRYHRLVEIEHAKYDDIGRYAAYLGFDAIVVAGQDYCVLLNRTAVRVQRENLR